MITALKRAWRRHRYSRHGVVVERRVPTEELGSGIGAWAVTPAGLAADSVVYSFGVGRDLSFDLSMVRRFGCTVHCFDPTPAAGQWVRTQQLPPQIVFHAVGLAAYDGMLAFHPPRKKTSAHFTPVRRYRDDAGQACVEAPVQRLTTIMNGLGHRRIDLLKVDIEGGEYDALRDVMEAGVPVGQLLVEFHHCYSTIPLARTVETVNLLRRSGFRIFHISPRTYEMSLLRVEGGRP